MIPLAHWLVRLHGNEDWDSWGQDWMNHVDKVGNLHWIDDFMPSPDWLRDHRSQQLDWRAFLYEMRADEIGRLLTRPPPDQRGDAWQRQLKLLETLYASDSRYAVVWIEEAEASRAGSVVSCPSGDDRRIYIRPQFPSVPFYLVALDGGWPMGPFNDNFYSSDGLGNGRPGWRTDPDGRLAWCDDGGGHDIRSASPQPGRRLHRRQQWGHGSDALPDRPHGDRRRGRGLCLA
jgi:hypothetical protein